MGHRGHPNVLQTSKWKFESDLKSNDGSIRSDVCLKYLLFPARSRLQVKPGIDRCVWERLPSCARVCFAFPGLARSSSSMTSSCFLPFGRLSESRYRSTSIKTPKQTNKPADPYEWKQSWSRVLEADKYWRRKKRLSILETPDTAPGLARKEETLSTL